MASSLMIELSRKLRTRPPHELETIHQHLHLSGQWVARSSPPARPSGAGITWGPKGVRSIPRQ